MGIPDDAEDQVADAAEQPDEAVPGTDDDLPASRSQGQQGLTQSGPPSDPSAPTG
ncbi:hypothetical protein [Nocardioides houyundeii]|uniref:hypothetical protein n=1 Tax=Nocardioides houyundeii TaxID=2045452 RepID=UPI00131521C5|nr:hypothetical protein [Nocardioides houyundeii]